MKKLLLASAIAAMSITAVQAAPTVYGKAFLSLDAVKGNDVAKADPDFNSRSKLNSNASRIGLKGSEALTANTDVIYQLEYRVDMDDNRQQFTSRDTYLGLSNKQLGTVVAGRLTAIDDYINYANVTQGGVVGGNDVLASFKSERANNSFAYFSPNYQGVQFMGMYVLDEHRGEETDNNPDRDSLGRDAFGVGAKYEPSNSPLKAGATYIQAGKNLKALRLSGAYAVNPALTVAGQYQHTNFGKDASKEHAMTISGSYAVAQTPWVAYGQLDLVDNFDGDKDNERQRLAAGAKYNFSKNAIGHLYGAYLQDKPQTGATAKTVGVGAGLEYKF